MYNIIHIKQAITQKTHDPHTPDKQELSLQIKKQIQLLLPPIIPRIVEQVYTYRKLEHQLQILSLQISEHGKSGGVIFVETSDGAFVLKANNQAAQDFFFNQLALMLDLNVPMMMTLGCYQPEFQKLVYLIQKYCHHDQVLYARLKTKLDFPFYQIMQYIPSISLTHIGKNKFAKYMVTEHKLYTIGICLAFDMIINNNDRYKFVWRGEGNINNILIEVLQTGKGVLEKAMQRDDQSIKLGNFAYIDHDGHMVNMNDPLARQNVQKYMESVAQFQLNMIQYLRKQNSFIPKQFEKLSKQISFFTQYNLSDQQIAKISQGIIYCTKKFLALYENQQVKSLHESMQKPTDTKTKQINYWNEHWNNEFKKVNLNFCETFHIKISAIYTTYPELINQIFEQVRKVIEANANSRRRVSQAKGKSSRRSSEVLSGRDQAGDGEGGQEVNGNDNHDQEDDVQQKNSSNKRRWRQKLQVFKQQNYK